MDEFGTPKQDVPPRAQEPEFAPFERRKPPVMEPSPALSQPEMPKAPQGEQQVQQQMGQVSQTQEKVPISQPMSAPTPVEAPMLEVFREPAPLETAMQAEEIEMPFVENIRDTASTTNTETTNSEAANSIKAGETLATFNVMESAPYARSRKWVYSMLGAVLVILAFSFGIDGWNSLPMAIAFIVLVVVYGMTVKRSDPETTIPLVFTTYGLQIAGQFYPYTLMRFFYLMEFPDYVHLTVVREGRFVVGTDIYLQKGEDVSRIRETLQEFVTENLSAKESVVQRLIRLLQL